MDNRDIRLLNLKYAVHKIGGTAALAERADCSKKYLEQILQGFQGKNDKNPRKLGDPLAASIARVLGHEPYWMDQPHEELWEASSSIQIDAGTKPSSVKHREDITIHQFDTGGRMGRAGLELRDQPGIIQSWRVSPEWLHKNIRNYTAVENLCLVTGFGDSMRPMFNPGDPLVLDAGVKSVEYDAIYFFRVGNEGYIKRLQRIPTEQGPVVRAKSENKAYDPFDITPKMEFEVFGQILKVWRSEEF